MKIKFKVPEWAIGRHIYIFAGTELLGNKECRISHKNSKHVAKYLPLKIKPEDGRCNGCGSCCDSNGISRKLLVQMKNALHGFRDYEDKCPFTTNTGCLLGAWTPYSCVKSICTDYEGCTERLEVAE